MTIENVQLRSFLEQLYQLTGGDTGTEVSMYEVGAALGLDRPEAGSVAEDLIIDGFSELKNLAGGISITAQGLQELDVAAEENSRESGFVALGNKEVVEPDVAQAVEAAVTEIKIAVSSAGMEYGAIEEIVIDIKTIETQLKSPRPKTKIIRQVLSSLLSALDGAQSNAKLAETIRRLIGS